MIEAMKQAYEVPLVEQLESVPKDARLVIDYADGMGTRFIPVGRMCHDAAKSLRQAIEQAEKQEPFCWAQCTTAGLYVSNEPDEYYTMPLYTAPQPQREWVGLTDEERIALWGVRSDGPSNSEIRGFAKSIEAKLKEKNT
jgi:hypothetical protein